MKRVEIFRVNSKITVPMNNSLLQISNFKSVTGYSTCKAVRFLLILALVMASGVLTGTSSPTLLKYSQLSISKQADQVRKSTKFFLPDEFIQTYPVATTSTCGCPGGSVVVGNDLNSSTNITSTTIPQFANGITICIFGILNINRFNYFFDCDFYIAEGSSIHVKNGYGLIISECDLMPCTDQMYQGIVVENGGTVLLYGNTIEDANYGLLVESGGHAYNVSGNSFLRNNIGVGLQSGASVSNDLYDNTFDGQTGLITGFTGQNPEPDYLPYAGIEAIGTTFTAGIIAPNTFTKLRNGIVTSNASFTAVNNSFTSIIPWVQSIFTLQYIDGIGINSVGSNLVNVSDNTFYDCRIGIRSHASALLKVEDNNMDAVELGIEDTYGRNLTRVHTNTISYRRFGIKVSFPTRSTFPSIYYNILNNTQTTDSSVAIDLSGAFGTFTFHPEINVNEIYIEGIKALGIRTNYVEQTGIISNEITGEGYGAGIQLTLTRFSHVFNNNISSSGALPQIGILVRTSERTRYCCNEISDVYTGFLFDNASPNSIWRNNYINRCFRGLLLNNGAYFGQQMQSVPSGNEWITFQQGNINGVNAINRNGTFFKLKSQIRAYECSLPEWPTYISPAQSCDDNATNWFRTTETASSTCIYDGPCAQFFAVVPEIDDWSIDVATGNFISEEFGDMHNWEGSRILYRDLRQDNDLLGVDAEVDSFYNSNTSGVLHEYYNVDSLLNDALSFSEGELENMEDELILINAKMTAIKLYADSLYNAANSTDSSYYHEFLVDLFSDANEATSDLNTLWDSWLEQRDTFLEDVLAANDLIEAEDDIQTFLQEVNHIYMESVAAGIFELNSTQSSDLSAIAELCPLEYGNAVYLARILKDLSGLNGYNDSLLCLPPSPIINSTGDENIGYSYQITPNPVSENLIITDRMCNQRMDKLIHIRDLNGKNILAERWSSTCVKEISTRNFMSGVFILSVENSTSGKNLFTSRILINR